MGVSHTGPAFHGPGSHAPAYEPVTADDLHAVAGHRPTARIGVTALGRVYLAQAPGERQVTLTVVHAALAAGDGFGARFHHAAQAAGRIRALGAPRVLGSGNEGSTYWIASVYVPAPTLHATVVAGGPLPTGVVLRLVAGLCDALQAMHHDGVVHGDLRPAHVLLAADGPKAVQYGMAALADVTGVTGAAAGGEPPAFLAPEQVAGMPAVPATDVFALGQLAAYASIGRPPFDDPSRVGQEEPDLNELPGELREIVTRCLIKDPALRPSLAQVTTMCRQAAPGPVPAGTGLGVSPGGAEGGPGAGPSHTAPQHPAPPGAVPPGAPSAGPGAPGAVPPGAVPPGAAPPGAVPPAHAIPLAVPPVPPPAPVGGMHGGVHGAVHGAMHGAFGWVPRPPQWVPRPPAAVRRRSGAGVAVAGLAIAIVAGFGLAQGWSGTGGGGADDRPGLGAAAPPSTATAGATPDPAPTTTPDPGGATPPGDPTPPDDSAGGETYLAVRLPAGAALSLQERPPVVRRGLDSGAFGFTADATAFAADEHRGRLAVLPGELPATPDACRTAAGPQVASVSRAAVEGTGARLCVHGVDGTLAVVTFRQITPFGDPDPYAVLDVTVWRIMDRSAESDQNGVVPARAGAAVARNSSEFRRTL